MGGFLSSKTHLNLSSQVMILIGSWWEFRRGKLPGGSAYVHFLLREERGSKGRGLKGSWQLLFKFITFFLMLSVVLLLALAFVPFPAHLWFIAGVSISYNATTTWPEVKAQS